MKTMTKKFGAIILAMAMCFSLCCVAFAADSEYTITVSNATIGKEYNAYKIFDATYVEDSDSVSYTISSTSDLYEAIAESGVFTLTPITGTDNYYVTANASDDEIISALEEMDIPSLVSASATVTADKTSIELDVGEAGYYYITSELGSIVTIDTAHPTATVIDKNETVGGDNFHKYVLDEDGNVVGDMGDAAMGDELNFDITSNVPLYAGDEIVTEYQFTDTLGGTGLEIEIELESEEEGNEHHISIVDGHYYADEALIDKFVTLTNSQGTTYDLHDVAYGITLEFTDVSYDEASGYIVCSGFILTYYTYNTETYVEGDASTFDTSKYPTDLTIDITYSTYVNDNANHAETNTATLSYWTTSYDTPTPEDPVPHDAQYSRDTIYEWDLKIVKVDSSNETIYLDGAEFTLVGTNLNHVKVSTTVTFEEIDPADMESGVTYYYLLKDGRYTTTAPTEETEDEYNSTNPGPYARSVVTTTVEDASDETHTANGTTASDGTLTFDGLTAGTYTLTEIVAPDGYNLLDSPIEIVVTFDSSTGLFTAVVDDETSYTLTDGELVLTIDNSTGSELPSTGGIGTTIFYIIGGVLVAGAVVVLITRRRMNSAD